MTVAIFLHCSIYEMLDLCKTSSSARYALVNQSKHDNIQGILIR